MKLSLSHCICAFTGGIILAAMIGFNSALAQYSSAITASWIAHLIGTITSLIIMVIASFYSSKNTEFDWTRKLPLWVYSGGIFGALTVVLAAITVNSELGLSITIALVMLGQLLFGFISDTTGLLGMQKTRFTVKDTLGITTVLLGCLLMIFGEK